MEVASFFTQDIFPESSLPQLSDIVDAAEGPFRLVCFRSDAAHYDHTLRLWQQRLEAGKDRACEMVGWEQYRRYHRYLRLSRMMFDRRVCTLYRMVFERRPASSFARHDSLDGTARRPWRRPRGRRPVALAVGPARAPAPCARRPALAPTGTPARLLPVAPGPGQEVVERQRVDDGLGRDPGRHRLFAPEGEPRELAGGVGVGVDGEAAAGRSRRP